jgi:hypothetical protein
LSGERRFSCVNIVGVPTGPLPTSSRNDIRKHDVMMSGDDKNNTTNNQSSSSSSSSLSSSPQMEWKDIAAQKQVLRRQIREKLKCLSKEEILMQLQSAWIVN